MNATESVLSLPGGAQLVLNQIRTAGFDASAKLVSLWFEQDLADLKLAAGLCNLPLPELAGGYPYGVVGTFHGTDKEIEYSVEAWAKAFGVEHELFEPWTVYRGKTVPAPGWTVMHGKARGLRFTVGGRLVETPKGPR